MSLLRTPPALIRYRPASGSLSSDHLGPRALRSERVIMSRSSPPIRPDAPVSPAPPDFTTHWLIQEAVPDDLVWAANDTFPALGQDSLHACRHPYAGRRRRTVSPIWPCPHGLPHWSNESAPPTPNTGFRWDSFSTLQCSRNATARVVARPPGPIRPREPSLSSRRGLSTRAFPQEGHPPRESGIATRHLRGIP